MEKTIHQYYPPILKLNIDEKSQKFNGPFSYSRSHMMQWSCLSPFIVADPSQQIRELTESLERAQSENGSLKSENEYLMEEVKSLKERIDQLEKQLADKNKEVGTTCMYVCMYVCCLCNCMGV